ncbi:MAG: hypothetical protein WCF67_02875 [Chitinophagaceae bacterium]
MKKSKSVYDLDFYKSLNGEKAIAERLKGRLPIIDIAGYPFFVDAHMGRLRPMDNFMTLGLDMINGGSLDSNTNLRSFYYDPVRMQEVKPDEKEAGLDHLLMVTVPDLHTLDPVGMAKIQRLDPLTHLGQQPFQMFTKATVVPAAILAQTAALKKQFLQRGKESKSRSTTKRKKH